MHPYKAKQLHFNRYICSFGENESKSVISLFDDYLKSWVCATLSFINIWSLVFSRSFFRVALWLDPLLILDFHFTSYAKTLENSFELIYCFSSRTVSPFWNLEGSFIVLLCFSFKLLMKSSLLTKSNGTFRVKDIQEYPHQGYLL